MKRDVHRENDEINLVGQLTRCDHRDQWGEEVGLKIGQRPRCVSAGPIYAQEIFRRDLAFLTVVISQLTRIGAVLIHDDDGVQATTAPVAMGCHRKDRGQGNER